MNINLYAVRNDFKLSHFVRFSFIHFIYTMKFFLVNLGLAAIFAYSLQQFCVDFADTHSFFQTYLNQWSNLSLWLLALPSAVLTVMWLEEVNG